MTIILWFVIAALTVDVGLIAALLLSRITCQPSSLTIPEIVPLIVLAGVLTAVLTFVFNLRRGRSEDILEAATDLFEKANEALTTKDGELTDHRRSWLSAARLIATAEKLSKSLTESSHKVIYKEKKEYWRSRLYDLIFPSPPEGLPSSFFAEKPEHINVYSHRVREPLSEKSIAFLYRFIKWPEDTTDPIGKEPNFTDKEIEHMRAFGPRGLGNLMAEARSRLPKVAPKK